MMNKKVLIVDDDDNMRSAVQTTLERMGIEVYTAENGKEGLDMATSQSFDLIISDMRMPIMDGETMFKMLKNASVETKVCFITAYGTVESAVKLIKEGAFDYILKPFAPEVLEELVKRAFELESHPQLIEDKKTIFRSPYMTQIFSIAKDVAESEATVLITGESGTGKEVLARFIHEHSKRKGDFVAINCAAIPESLIESELFGYERGAFTGAVNRKEGKFELAEGGTLLLDEIGEIPINLQAKLLRVLQEKEIERLGGTKKQKVDVRIIATTNRNLREEVKNGNFREDLFYRLNVINIEIPPLRERKEDIEPLTLFFIDKYCSINKKPLKKLSKDALELLLNYDWPGNVRELEHTIERAVILSKDHFITPLNLFLHGISISSYNEYLANRSKLKPDETVESRPPEEPKQPISISAGMTIADMERELILNTLKETKGNRTKAAEILGITVRTLRNKLHEYREQGINVDDFLMED
ncbi:MAG: sigma-54 dependent transcriptional regulator [Calditerrivibrio sp.]|nr:sigma-54 dependent transcriptional regulator [Calditerrivibrio sp.]